MIRMQPSSRSFSPSSSSSRQQQHGCVEMILKQQQEEPPSSPTSAAVLQLDHSDDVVVLMVPEDEFEADQKQQEAHHDDAPLCLLRSSLKPVAIPTITAGASPIPAVVVPTRRVVEQQHAVLRYQAERLFPNDEEAPYPDDENSFEDQNDCLELSFDQDDDDNDDDDDMGLLLGLQFIDTDDEEC